jgi:uncharacterized phage infection (PIP) family protein YhgE
MLIRISLIVAIIAGLAVGGMNFVTIKEKVTTLQANLKEQTEGRQKAETDLASTRKELDKTTADLKQTKTTLEATTEERNKAVAVAETEKNRADKLTDDLTKTRQERDTSQSELAAYKTSGLTAEQVAAATKQIKNLSDQLSGQEQENKLLGRKIDNLQTKLAKYENPNTHILLPAALRGKVLASDPKWNFVILNVGGEQGIKQDGELLVNRNGQLVAKVRVSSIQKNRCVANVIPGWQLGEVFEGDQVIPAYPSES